MSAKERYLASMLLECILNGDIGYAKKLLSIGANPNFILDEGASPIHVAVSLEDATLSKHFTDLLLQFGANPNVRSSEGSTPLHASAAFGRANNVSILLQYGGDPDLLDQDGMTVMDNAKAANSQMCQIQVMLFKQGQAKDSNEPHPDVNPNTLSQYKRAALTEQKLSDTDDTLISDASVSSFLPSSSESSDNSTLNYTKQQIQMIQDHFDPSIYQIDVTSPDHPVLVLRTSDETVSHGSDEVSTSSASFHTCQSAAASETSEVSQADLPKQPERHLCGTDGFSHLPNRKQNDPERFDFRQSTAERAFASSDSTDDSLAFDPEELNCIFLDNSTFTFEDDTISSEMMEDFDKLSLVPVDESSLSGSVQKESPSQYCATRMVHNIISADSGLASSWNDVDIYPRTSSRDPSVMSEDASLSSGHSRCSRTSTVCSCSTIVVERLVDADEGYSLVETHLIPREDGTQCDTDCSIHSQNLTALSDWLDVSTLSQGNGAGSSGDVVIPPEMAALSNSAIYSKLVRLEDNPGPVTQSTRNIYLKRLIELERNPDLARRISTASTPGFLAEVKQALTGNLDLSTATILNLEVDMCRPFSDPDPTHKWREGVKKCCFNYFLLDPRVTQNLPVRAKAMGDSEAFECFLRSIFYVGKGVRSRPYAHFKEAIRYMTKKQDLTQDPGYKIAHILDVWHANLGVISLHIFQNVIACEAYTREACMIEALGLFRLTNKIPGKHYGPTLTWPIRKRRILGVLLLRKAFRIFLLEGERQIHLRDIKS